MGQRKRKGRLWTAVFLAILAVTAAGLFCVLRFRGGVAISPSADVEVKEEVFYCQKDPRWSGQRLGKSTYTMESSGCLVCCVAASLELQGRGREDPGELSQALSRAGALDEEGNLLWDALPRLDKNISSERCPFVDGRQVMEQLQAGRYPIVRVRVNGWGNYHYVLIVGAKGGEYQCMDPLSGQQEMVPLADFGGRVYAVRYVDW
ncbi:MAG: hypothetical protein HFG60_08510 [Lachnospiraceae bacterium]|nr:hypothetical protein [Lachnospiraceae bacterium]